MAWFTPFIIPAVMNAPQLLRNGNVGQFALNTGIGGGTGMALNSMIPSQVAGSALSQGPVASNIPSHLIGQQSLAQGITPNVTGAATSIGGANLTSPTNIASGLYTGPKSMMAQNLAQPTDVVKPLPENTFQFDAGLANAADVQKYPDYSITQDKLGRSLDYTGGGAEVAEKPLTTKVFEKVTDYVKEKPFEAAMLGMMGGGAIYEGLKEPQRPPLQPTLGPKLGGGQANVGTPLQVRRPMRRRG